MAIKGIDLGNYNLKTSDGLTIKATFSDKAPKNQLVSHETIEYNDMFYYIGEGTFNTNPRKCEKDFMPLFLYALAKKNHQNQVNVVVGLPAAQFNEDNKKMSEQFIGEFKFKLNGRSKTVNVEKCSVFPEGVAAYYSLPKEERVGDIIIIDIGGRTVNIAWFREGKLMLAATINHGVFNIYHSVLDVINPNGVRIGLNMEYVEKNLVSGISYYGEDFDLDFVKGIKKDLYDDILEEIHMKEFPLGISKIKLVGGGAELMLDVFKENNEKLNVEIMDKNIFANANGFKEVGEMLWVKK